ncbi:MAG: amidohydrolase [Clostridia bacterium]|nr:amidohydrolase [Clostridia bacterium]
MEEFDIYSAVLSDKDRMIRERRYLHEHPELSLKEDKTCAYIADSLRALGMDVHEVVRGGVIGVLNGTAEGPAILLRADVDALPIQESERNLANVRTCRSQVPGVMHACGHDAHMAMLLCAARILSRVPLRVPVVFAFERAEELNDGIYELLPYLNAHFNIGACYATHVRWDIEAGQIAICRGTAMAGGFGFKFEIVGSGGHGSRPDLAVNPIDCFAAIHTRLSTLRMTMVEPDQVLTCSVGTVHAGDVHNIIPDRLVFSGTVRTCDTAGAGERFAAAMKKVVLDTAEAYGCSINILHFPKLLYETANNEPFRQRLLSAIFTQLPKVPVAEVKPWMASETMSAYLKWWPGVLSFTGIRNERIGSGAGHRTPEFDIDEDAMVSGAAAAVLAALEWNRMPAPVPDGFRTESLAGILERRL